jgi:hypothetical protein
VRIAIAILVAALASGCKGKKKAPEPERPAPQPAANGSAAGSAAGPEHILYFPKASGSGPVKTDQPLDKARNEKMSSLDVAGWNKEIRFISDKSLEVRYKTEKRPILSVLILAGPCFDCIPPELPKWKAKEDALKNVLPPELRERKDTLFEIGEVKLAGAPLIYTYQLAHGVGPDEDPAQQQGPYSHAYIAYHNDGVNQIRVTASYADMPVATREDLASVISRGDLEKLALAFLDAYTHAW